MFNILLKLINKKTLLKGQYKFNKFEFFFPSEPPRKMLMSVKIEKYRVHEHNVFTLNPGNRNRKHILYLHGGAYTAGFARPHWDFLHILIKNLNCTILAPDYPLAPAHTYKQSFAMVSDLYRRLLKRVDPSDIILMGDSSGGGFALALAQLLKNENIPQPSQIILLSPWLDISLSNPEIRDIDPSDLFLNVEGLRSAGRAYSGNTNPYNYLLSPIYGSLQGLGNISVFIGSREILVADARKLKSKADKEGIVLNYYEYKGMFHAWMLLNLPESTVAKRQILDLIPVSV